MKRRVHLIFPKDLVQKPLTWELSKKFDIVFNVRRAKITETAGESVLELEGAGFGPPGQGQVTLGGVPVQPELIQSWSDSRIRMVVPAAAQTDSPPLSTSRITGTGSTLTGMPTMASASSGVPPIA